MFFLQKQHSQIGKIIKVIRNKIHNLLLACEIAESNPLRGPKRYCCFTSYCDTIKANYYISLDMQQSGQLKQVKEIQPEHH